MAKFRPVGHEDRLSVVEHLDELRSRIIISLVAFSVVAIYVSKGGLRGISWVAVPIGAIWCVLSIWLGRKQRQLAEAKHDQTARMTGTAAPEAA